MNRRGFIATLTALAGVALARIKAPVAPTQYPVLRKFTITTGTSTLPAKPFNSWPPGTRIVYVCGKDGKYQWVPIDKP